MIGLQQQQNPICQKHNQPAIFLSMRSNKSITQFFCQYCIQEETKLQPISEFQKAQNQIFQQIQSQSQNNVYILKRLQNQILFYKDQILRDLDKILVYLVNQIQSMNNDFEKQTKMLSVISIQTIEQINQAHKQFIQSAQTFQQKVTQQLQNLVRSQKIQDILSILNELNLEVLQMDTNLIFKNNQEGMPKTKCEQLVKKTIEINISRYEYRLLEQFSIKQKEICKAIAINEQNNYVAAACYDIIKLFKFKSGELQLYQKLTNRQNEQILCLQFMKLQDSFAVGGAFDQILIYDQNSQTNLWEKIFVLNGHNNSINCLLIRSNDSLIISASNDNSIKFWQKSCYDWQCNNTIITSEPPVQSLSINYLNSVLISSNNQSIIVYEQIQAQWKQKQTIQHNQQGFRLCFLDEFQFSFQVTSEVYIYNYDKVENQFKKQTSVSVFSYGLDEGLFPQQFIRQKELLISKNNYSLNIIRRQKDGQFINDQTIFFKEEPFGNITNDGEFLITWDYKSQMIQVRKLNEII